MASPHWDPVPTPPELEEAFAKEGTSREILAPIARDDPYGCAEYLVQLMPRISSSQIASEIERLTDGAVRLTKRQAKQWREAIVTKAPRPPVGGRVDLGEIDPNTAEDQLRNAERLGNPKAALQWARVAEAKRELGMADDVEEAEADLSRLTDVMFSAYKALTDIANGVDLDDEALWWRSLFARVPGQRAEVHPAHVPLPAGSPIPPILTGTKG